MAIDYEKQKTIYEIKLHESTLVKIKGTGYPYEYMITRVPSGWIYEDMNPNITTRHEFFVPYSNKFEGRNKQKEPWEE